MSITFEISAGPAAGQKFWLRLNQSLSIGRSRDADYPIPTDPTISGIHLRVGYDHQGGWIEDLQSSNGTFVNGQKVVQRTPVVNGDEIRFGETRITVRLAATYSSTAPPPPANRQPAAVVPPRDVPKIQPTPMASQVHGDSSAINPRQTSLDQVPAPRSALSGASNSSPPAASHDNGQLPVGPLDLQLEGAGNVTLLPWINARHEGRLTVIYKLTFVVSAQGTVDFADEQLPICVEDQLESEDPESPVKLESDLVPYKIRSDILVVGHVYAPQGRAVTQLEASLKVGALSHTVQVWGDRHWSLPSMVQLVPRLIGPEPFTQLPLTFRRSFGGYDRSGGSYCAENLSGVGYINNLSAKSVHQVQLPNFEDPTQPIIQYDSHPRPMGFGVWGRGWLPRLEYARAALEPPFLPAYEFFNAASPPLQYAGYLQGNEPVTLRNLTPDGQFNFRLPGVQPRVSVLRNEAITQADGLTSHHLIRSSGENQIVPRLDTLVLLPDTRQFFLVFRAVFPLKSLDDPDIMSVEVLGPSASTR